MKKIWKFILEIMPLQQIEMPEGAEILCVQNQGGMGYLWATVDPSKKLESREILIIGTGYTFPEVNAHLRYIGTFQVMDGQLVWHVFEPQAKTFKIENFVCAGCGTQIGTYTSVIKDGGDIKCPTCGTKYEGESTEV